MPRGQRKLNIRTLNQCRNHVAYIEHYLQELEQMYLELHPEIAKGMHTARELNEMLDDLIISIIEAI